MVDATEKKFSIRDLAIAVVLAAVLGGIVTYFIAASRFEREIDAARTQVEEIEREFNVLRDQVREFLPSE